MSANDLVALAVMFMPPFVFFGRGMTELATDIRRWLARPS